jgi:hypothetical protein
MRNVSDKRCRENQNTYFVFSNVLKKRRAVYEIIWKNVVELSRPHMKNMAHAHYMLGN